MKVQVLQASKADPLTFIVMSEGVAFEYAFMEDTALDVLKRLRAAARRQETITVDVVDVKSTRRLGSGL